ncbi:MAG: VWA domain-containing protein, partial [Armatimonadota bacterium]|nr:BatA and WFA domain-containing protein [Armatimonadota bacterium]MDW8026598.1 VWA domain-containing protein [Armatimonadota bacterium]
MVLQTPFLLWWFLPIMLFIILIYLLKIRRKEVKVPAVFLFPRITTDVRANAPWQRLRFNWLMILQLLAALLLLIALARPMIKGEGLIGKTVIFVLDASASMKAKDVYPDRFTEAKRWIYRHLNTLHSDDQAALIVAMTEPRVVASLTTNHQQVRQALENLSATDAPSDIGAAMRLAANIVINRRNACIVLISDGSFGEIRDFSPGAAEVIYKVVGKSSKNAGFVTLDAQRYGNQLRLFVAIRNFSQQFMNGILSWFADGQIIDAQELKLSPGKIHGEMLELPATVKEVKVRWECDSDILSSDNVVHWVGSGLKPIRILLVSYGNFFLEKALSLEPGTLVDKIVQLPKETVNNPSFSGDYDIVIFDGIKPQPVNAKALWIIGVADGNFVQQIGKV